MVHLWVGRVGAAPDLSEPQDFKNVSLQMMINQTVVFRRLFFLNRTRFKF